MTQDLVSGLAALSAYGVIFLVNVEFLRFARESDIEGDTLLSIFQVIEYMLLDVILISILNFIVESGIFSNLPPTTLVGTLGVPVMFMKWIELAKKILPNLSSTENGKVNSFLWWALAFYMPYSLISLITRDVRLLIFMSVVYGFVYCGVFISKILKRMSKGR